MKIRTNLRDGLNAVTPVISAILGIAIVTCAMSSAVLVGVPYINKLQNISTLENTEMQFDQIIDNIKDVTNGIGDESNVLKVTATDGSLSVNKDEYDRTILLYSYNDNSKYNFTVVGLDDNNKVFFLDNEPNEYSNMWVRVKWFEWYNDPEITEDISVESDGKVTATQRDLLGKIEMSIYYPSIADSNLKSKIWLFDSNSLKFILPTGEGTHEISLENNGIIYFEDGEGPVVKRPFNGYFESGSFRIHTIQTLTSKSVSVGQNGFKVHINVSSLGTWKQEAKNVYNLRLQLHGDNRDTWINYFNNKKTL